jgi:hypothetical protein
LSHLLQEHGWMVPAIQTVHILCIAVVFPAMALYCLRLCLRPHGGGAGAVRARSRLRAAWRTLGVMLASGTLLIFAEPTRELPNPAFQAKMALLVAAMLVTAWCQRAGRTAAAGAPAATGLATLRAGAALALLLWSATAVAGRWIAYMIET